jgi:hypothetical protein
VPGADFPNAWTNSGSEAAAAQEEPWEIDRSYSQTRRAPSLLDTGSGCLAKRTVGVLPHPSRIVAGPVSSARCSRFVQTPSPGTPVSRMRPGTQQRPRLANPASRIAGKKDIILSKRRESAPQSANRQAHPGLLQACYKRRTYSLIKRIQARTRKRTRRTGYATHTTGGLYTSRYR